MKSTRKKKPMRKEATRARPRLRTRPPAPMTPLQIVILTSPAERLRALLDVVQRLMDVAKLADATLREVHLGAITPLEDHIAKLSDAEFRSLGDWLGSITKRRPDHRDDLAAGLVELGRWFANLTSKGDSDHEVDRGWLSYLRTADGDLLRIFRGSFAMALVDEAASLLQRAGPHRLRVCPLVLRTGERCGRIFIGERHQKYCTPPHAQIQARRENRRRERLETKKGH